MRYEAIIFDLDGTAIPNEPNGMPSDELVQTVRDAQSTMRLSAATGRPYKNAKPILDKLNLSDPCVISAGTQIVDPKTGVILWEAVIDQSAIEAIFKICEHYHYEVLVRDELVGEGGRVSNRATQEEINVVYIMACAEADAKVILEELSRIPDISASGVTSWTHEGVDVHITHKNATKEHAVQKLLEMINVSKENTIGVGDANNDVHLFKAVGHKVAMGNATELLKSQADEVCANVSENGLAQLVKKYAGKQ